MKPSTYFCLMQTLPGEENKKMRFSELRWDGE